MSSYQKFFLQNKFQVKEDLENKMILNAYRGVLRSIKSRRSKEETKIIRKAFNLAVNAHRNVRRKSGEPYIFHPLAVARICGDEIGLGTTHCLRINARHS